MGLGFWTLDIQSDKKVSLTRKLGFWDVFCIAAGAMISSGLFILPGQAFQLCGPAVILAYALAALMMIPALLSKCELTTAMPKSGGTYFFIERSMGALPGMLAGLAGWLGLALKSAFAMVGIGAFAQLIWGEAAGSEWLIKAVAVGCCVVFVLLNTFSVKLTGRAQIVMVAGLLVALGIFVVAGIPNVRQHPNFNNLLDKGFGSVFATAGLVFISFGGLTKIASVAEEVHHPGRNLPRAMILAFLVVSVLYVAVVFVIVGVLPPDQIATDHSVNLTPVSTAAGSFMGKGGMILLSAAAIIAFITTGNGGLLAASRSPLAMSRDGLLPRSIGKTSRRFGTPFISVWLTGAFMIAIILLLSIADLVKVASTMMLVLFLLVNVAVLIMRGSRIPNYRPRYRSPLFPWVQLVGIVIYAMLIIDLTAMLGLLPLVTTGLFLLGGTVWYLFYVRPHITRESALVYMVRNVVAREIRRSHLEEELREIALERDEIVHDRFDQIVKRCEILDLHGPVSVETMFSKAADLLAGRLDVPPEVLLEKFRTREADSSTMIQPGLAIPHIIVDGENLFDVLLVRCRNGIVFDVEQPYVKTAFILVGSADERNYHLRALMAIAQIVQEEGFMERWLSASGPEHLRDLVLLSGRTREKES
ncbi:MAG TPA: amino acid permease [Phycisphaerae bacterium]|nr:amino acid permease [Phycisphaerae bacterium]